jgi:hypothetical protein
MQKQCESNKQSIQESIGSKQELLSKLQNNEPVVLDGQKYIVTNNE